VIPSLVEQVAAELEFRAILIDIDRRLRIAGAELDRWYTEDEAERARWYTEDEAERARRA